MTLPAAAATSTGGVNETTPVFASETVTESSTNTLPPGSSHLNRTDFPVRSKGCAPSKMVATMDVEFSSPCEMRMVWAAKLPLLSTLSETALVGIPHHSFLVVDYQPHSVTCVISNCVPGLLLTDVPEGCSAKR